MEALYKNKLVLYNPVSLKCEIFAVDSSGKPVVTDDLLAVTSSVSTIHRSKSRFCQQPTNVKLKSFNCSSCFVVVITLLALSVAVSDMVEYS